MRAMGLHKNLKLVITQTLTSFLPLQELMAPHHLCMVLHRLFMVIVVTHMRRQPTLRWAAIHPTLPIILWNMVTNPTRKIVTTSTLPVLRISCQLTVTMRHQVVLVL